MTFHNPEAKPVTHNDGDFTLYDDTGYHHIAAINSSGEVELKDCTLSGEQVLWLSDWIEENKGVLDVN